MIKTIDVECNAANPNLPLKPMFAFVNSPSSIRVRNVPKRIGDWCIRKVYFTVVYPDSTVKTAECVLTGGVWVGTVAGTSTPGTSDFGYAIYASGIDEHGNPVTGYCLGKGDVEILDDQGEVTPSEHATYTKLLSAEPTDPQDGNIWQVNGTYYIYQDGQTWPIGDDSGLIGELSGKVYDLSAKVHEDYIVDTIGNTISANLSVTKIEHSDNWTVYLDNQRFELDGTKYSAQYGNTEEPAEGEYCVELLNYSEDEDTRWTIYANKYVNGDWQTILYESVTAPKDVDSLSGEGWEARWQEAYDIQDKLVLESELENFYPKSELSTATEIENALSEKQDNLADQQISAINQVVDERTTVVDVLGGTRLQFNVVGAVTAQMVQSWATVGDIEKIKLGTVVTAIGNNAFQNQVNLTTVEMPNVVTIGDYAFENCHKLTSPKLPDTLSGAGYSAFGMCSSITDVDVPASVYQTGSKIFQNCTSISAATIRTNRPNSHMFYNCVNLSSVTIENAEFISYQMFYGCSALTELEIPKSATIINSTAFKNCPALTSIVFKDRLSTEIPSDKPWGAPNPNLQITTWNAASKEWVSEQNYATQTYAVQNLSGVAKIQSIELSAYSAISATADLSTLYVIPEEV